MQYIGKLNKKLYEQIINNKIVTDDIVFTDKQIEHVEEDHRERKGLYEKYKDKLLDIINEPDYIFADNKPDTLCIAKKLDERIWLVLKLNTNPYNDYKNSIISMQRLGDTKLKQYERTKKILYKKE